MRTVCCSSNLMGGEGVCPRVSAWGVSAEGGCLPREVICQGRVSQRWCIQACTKANTLLWTEFLTHACENITFPQLRLQTVMKYCIQIVIKFKADPALRFRSYLMICQRTRVHLLEMNHKNHCHTGGQ